MSDIFQVQPQAPQPPAVGGRIPYRPGEGEALQRLGGALTGLAGTIINISADQMRREAAELKKKEAERKARERELKNMSVNNELAAAINSYNQSYDDWERGLIENDDYTSYLPEYDERKAEFYNQSRDTHIKDPDAAMLFQKWFNQQDFKRRDEIGDLAQKRQINKNLVDFRVNLQEAVKAKDADMANQLIDAASPYLEPGTIVELREAVKTDVAYNTLYEQALALAQEAGEDPTMLTAEAKREIYSYIMNEQNEPDLSRTDRKKLVKELEGELAYIQSIKDEQWRKDNEEAYKELVRTFGTPQGSRGRLEELADKLTGREYEHFDHLYDEFEANQREAEAEAQIREIELFLIAADYNRTLGPETIAQYADVLPQDRIEHWERRLEENEREDREFLEKMQKEAEKRVNAVEFYGAWTDLIGGRVRDPSKFWDRELYPDLTNDDRKELEKELTSRLEKERKERERLQKEAEKKNVFEVTDPAAEAEVIQALYDPDIDTADYIALVKSKHGRGLSNADTLKYLDKVESARKAKEDPEIQGAVESIKDYWDRQIKAEKNPDKRQKLILEKGRALKALQSAIDEGELTPRGIGELADNMVKEKKIIWYRTWFHNALNKLTFGLAASAEEVAEAHGRPVSEELEPERKAISPEETFRRRLGLAEGQYEVDKLDDGTEAYVFEGKYYVTYQDQIYVYNPETQGFEVYR